MTPVRRTKDEGSDTDLQLEVEQLRAQLEETERRFAEYRRTHPISASAIKGKETSAYHRGYQFGKAER